MLGEAVHDIESRFDAGRLRYANSVGQEGGSE
jgi:hypothetical protein